MIGEEKEMLGVMSLVEALQVRPTNNWSLLSGRAAASLDMSRG